MGITVLGNVLMDWSEYEIDDEIYIPCDVGNLSVDTEVHVLPFERYRGREFEGRHYFLGIEQIRDVIEDLEAYLKRSLTPIERLKATVHYARYDANDPAALVED
jgi:hypothetical protein